jgi:hypothetical protein
MYVNRPFETGSTPIAPDPMLQEDAEALVSAFEKRFGPGLLNADEATLASFFDARGGFNWTVVTRDGMPEAFFRQPAFAMRPRWTFVPRDEVPEEIAGRLIY